MFKTKPARARGIAIVSQSSPKPVSGYFYIGWSRGPSERLSQAAGPIAEVPNNGPATANSFGTCGTRNNRFVLPSATSICPPTCQELFWFLIAEKGYEFFLLALRRILWEHSVRTESAARHHVNNFLAAPVTRALAILAQGHSGIPSINDTSF